MQDAGRVIDEPAMARIGPRHFGVPPRASRQWQIDLGRRVVVVGTYFTGFKVNPSQSFVAFGPEGVLRILHYWLSILGAVPALDSQRWAPWLGAGLLAVFGYAAARGGLRRERIAVFLALEMASMLVGE